MKKIFFPLFMFLILSIGTTFATEGVSQSASMNVLRNEPAGFGDLYWGETLNMVISTHDSKYMEGNSREVQYGIMVTDTKGDLYLRGNVLVFATFMEGKLRAIRIPLMGQYSNILLPLIELYGMPKYNKTLYIWKGNKSIIVLSPLDKAKDDGMIYLADASLFYNH